MSTEFFWRLPLGSDGPQLALDKNNRGAAVHRPATSRRARLPSGEPDGFTYIDYIAQVAKAAELAGFEGALLPTGPEPWVVAGGAGARDSPHQFLIAFQATWTLPAYAAQQAAILQTVSRNRLEWNIITGGVPAAQRANGDFLGHDLRYKRTGEFLDIVKGLWENDAFSYEGEVYRLDNGSLWPGARSRAPPERVFLRLFGCCVGRGRAPCRRLSQLGRAGGEAQTTFERVRELAAEQGRTVRSAFASICWRGETEEAAWNEARRQYDLIDAKTAAILNRINGGSDSVGAARQSAYHQNKDRFERSHRRVPICGPASVKPSQDRLWGFGRQLSECGGTAVGIP